MALCGHASLGVNGPPSYAVYGGGIGFSLSQPMGTTASMPVQATGTGIAYTVSSLPANGLRVNVKTASSADVYCAPVTTASGTIPWASFNTKCFDSPVDGTALAGVPADLTLIEFQFVTATTASTADVCVTKVAFAP
jgi:hypothetical protein